MSQPACTRYLHVVTPSARQADRAEQIPMACIPGFVDEVGGTEELHGIAARAKLQSRNMFVQSFYCTVVPRGTDCSDLGRF